MDHKSSFDIKTPNEFFEQMVLPQYDDFLKNNASSRYALLCLVLNYHMYEWANNKTEFNKTDFRTRYPGKQGLIELFDLARKVTNGTKHFKNKIETRTQIGFSPEFSVFTRVLRQFWQTALRH